MQNSQNTQNLAQNFASLNSENSAQNAFLKEPPYRLNTAYALYLIIGFFSAHRFYLGRWVSAIFQMLGAFGFLMWSAFLFVALIFYSPDTLDFMRAYKPDLDLSDADARAFADKVMKSVKVFALPNLIYVFWVIYDFFHLEDMVKEANADKGAGAVSGDRDLEVEEKRGNLSSAKTLLYIASAISILMAVLTLFGKDIEALKAAPIASAICAAIGVWFIAEIIRSRTLLRNLIFFIIIDAVATLPVMMLVLGDKSTFYVALAGVCTLLCVIYAMFIYKELYECSGRKIFARAFFVYALLAILLFGTYCYSMVLTAILAQIASIINSLFIAACVRECDVFVYSQNNYYLKNLKFHLSELNKLVV